MSRQPDYVSDDGAIQLYCGDCLEVLPGLADSSVSLIATDPPYFKVKGEAWDRQWDKADGFLEWLGVSLEQWRRNQQTSNFSYGEQCKWINKKNS